MDVNVKVAYVSSMIVETFDVFAHFKLVLMILIFCQQ